MALPNTLFARLATRLPPHPTWVLAVVGGAGFLAAAALIAFHHHWAGTVALLVGLAAAGLGQAPRVQLLGLMALPFGFGLADPPRALAAMFLMFAMAVLGTVARTNVSVVIWPIAAVMLLACAFPYYFSLSAYLVGITCFVMAGHDVAKGRS
ncbi:MAG TPA: hypothetical protein VGM26_07480 [Rhizomicrobium sp.]|jgi:hypothetical protein